jgi:FkbM family methyltransferase
LNALPTIIHQTWKSRTLPAGAQRLVQSWGELHPNWEYRLWTDDDNRALIARRYPELLATYDGYRHGVQRADASRIAILHHCGGVYADLDVECLAPLDGLFSPQDLSLLAEPAEHGPLYAKTFIVSNAVMAAPAGHPVLRRILDALVEAADPAADPPDVLGTTGPLFLSRLLERIGDQGIHWISAATFFPVPAASPLLDQVLDQAPGYEQHLEEWRRQGARGVHYWVNSWSRDLHGRLDTPGDGQIEGFVFHPGRDSPGYDLGLHGRDLRRLAETCARHPEAVAFNTDGYLKYYLPRRSLWRRMRWADASQGLYVKRSYHGWTWLRSFLRWRLGAHPPVWTDASNIGDLPDPPRGRPQSSLSRRLAEACAAAHVALARRIDARWLRRGRAGVVHAARHRAYLHGLRQLELGGGVDQAILSSMTHDDEYGIVERRFQADDLILDIGAHIGIFSHLCHRRGSRRIVAFEPDPVSHALLRRNLGGRPGVRLESRAVFRSDHPQQPIQLRPSDRSPTNSGSVTLMFDGRGIGLDTQQLSGPPAPRDAVEAIAFDQVLRDCGRVRLLKLDCEGSEFPILLTSRELARVDEIVGEYHEIQPGLMPALAPEARVEGYPAYRAGDLVEALTRAGFRVTTTATTPNVGIFHAVRPHDPDRSP